ncbi:MAG: imidazolonepropionase-like amidohydrolase [Planctomycetota bacterium]|jgi:imidazolonepropionase-like amidohydrolase
MKKLTITILLIINLFLTPMAAAEKSGIVAIVGATVVDLNGKKPIKNSVIIVTGERITSIGNADNVSVPANANVIDARGTWLIPGLMNMHVHLGLIFPGKNQAELADETEGELILRITANAREVLQAGVTTIRIPGEKNHVDLALKKAISKGQAMGPRIFSAGETLAITGGHGSKPGKIYYDGPHELMKAARREISAGATWVKILISGGIATNGGDISQALMTPEEIRAVIDVAHRFGAKVAAHSGSNAATDLAIDAGIDSIEHGYTLGRKVIRKMKKNGTWLVPTIVVTQPATQAFFEEMGTPEWFLNRRNSVGKVHWKALQMAIEEGVDIALGTDQLPFEPNDGTTATVREAQYYVEAGMTPLQALRAATIEPARMLGADIEIGSLEVGKFADIVAVDSDPGLDIKALRNIQLVMKSGEVYKNQLEK